MNISIEFTTKHGNPVQGRSLCYGVFDMMSTLE